MRALIVADIHANLEAFRAVLEDTADRGGIDELWCLGDVVGYGPDPMACVELLKLQEYVCVVGNHDLAAIGKLDTRDFNPYAAAANRWTSSRLRPEDVVYLSQLPEVLRKSSFTLAHGSLRHPIWEYILSVEAALATFELLDTQCCLVGHSHTPFLCKEAEGGCQFEELRERAPLVMRNERWIVNPGAVGQPRDGDPRSSYAIYDDEENTLVGYRVEYDITATQEKMRRAGLPDILIQRLIYGR